MQNDLDIAAEALLQEIKPAQAVAAFEHVIADEVPLALAGGGVVNAPRLGLLLWPMAAINRVVAGYSLLDGDVRPHLRRAKLPILFVHGTEDSTVPFAMGKELYEMYQGPKDCLFVEGAHHVESMHRAPEAYCAKLDKFINQYIKERR